MECEQIDLDDKNSPLLPPNEIMQSPDASVDGSRRSTTFKSAKQARDNFKRLQRLPSSSRRQRKFVYGALYSNLFDGFYLIDPTKEDVDLKVAIPSSDDTMIHVRLISPEDGIGRDKLLKSVLALGDSLTGNGNARGGKVGDVGAMHALGYRCAKTKEIYVGTTTSADKIRKASVLMRHWMEDNLRDVLKNLLESDQEQNTSGSLDCMLQGPGSRIMFSVNLGNSPHYDSGDSSYSVAIWTEQRPGLAKNWYFVLPNVSYKGSNGMAIKLVHGVLISWDGRKIYHCTSKTNVGERNKTYGCMWGSSK